MLHQKVQDLACSLKEMRQAFEDEKMARRNDNDRRGQGGGSSTPSLLSGEVQQVKAEMEILKRFLEEEAQARKTGDALSGEACMQLQAVLELEGKQRIAIGAKLEDHLRLTLADFEHKMRDLASSLRDENTGLRRYMQSTGNLSESLRSPMSHDPSKFVEDVHSDVERKVRELRHSLDVEAKERRAADDDILQRIGELFVRMEQEASNHHSARTRDLVDHSARAKELGDQARTKELSEHSARIKELGDRIHELSDKIDHEMRERISTHEVTVARVRELNVAIEHHHETRQKEDHELRLRSCNTGQEDLTLEREERISDISSLRREIMAIHRKADDVQTSLLIAKDALPARHGAMDEMKPAVAEKLKVLFDQLSVEINERRSAEEMTAHRVQDLAAALKQEKSERESGDSSTRTQLVSCLKELVSEKEKRVDEHTSLRRLLQTLEEQVGQQLSDLRLSLEAEVNVRMQADELLGKRQHLDPNETVKILRGELEIEIKQRVAETEHLKAQVYEALEGGSVQKEREERQMEDEALHHLLTSLTEQTNDIFDEARKGWEEESQRLWEALHTHTHDVHLKNPNEGGLGVAEGHMERPTFSVGSQLVGSMMSQKMPGGSTMGKSPPPVSVMRGCGGGFHWPNISPGSRTSPMTSTRDALARGSYLDHFTPSRAKS